MGREGTEPSGGPLKTGVLWLVEGRPSAAVYTYGGLAARREQIGGHGFVARGRTGTRCQARMKTRLVWLAVFTEVALRSARYQARGTGIAHTEPPMPAPSLAFGSLTAR